MVKLGFYVPQSHLEQVKQACFEAGAGKIGRYDHCSWQTEGQGQFRPLSGSNPFLGTKNRVETVTEYRVEMVCEKALIGKVVRALKRAHPYEMPAYDVVELMRV